MKYEVIEIQGAEVNGVADKWNIIKRTDESGVETFIPCDPANSDYQRYLNPEAEQSTPIVEVTQ
jgi:hypothetical protein